MGAVSFSLDTKLADCIQRALGCDIFVETGTFEGDTAIVAAEIFPQVISIELSQSLVQKARQRTARLNNVEIIEGDSPGALDALSPRLREKGVFYWLDAHWCNADATSGKKSQCPLIRELASIGTIGKDSRDSHR